MDHTVFHEWQINKQTTYRHSGSPVSRDFFVFIIKGKGRGTDLLECVFIFGRIKKDKGQGKESVTLEL